MPVTTRILIFLVGDPYKIYIYKPSFATVGGTIPGGDHPPSAAKARVVNRTPNVHESWGFVRFRSAEGVEIWFQNGGNYGFMFDLYKYINKITLITYM